MDKGIDRPPAPVPSSGLRPAVRGSNAGPAHAGAAHAGGGQGPGVVDGTASVHGARGARNRWMHTCVVDGRPRGALIDSVDHLPPRSALMWRTRKFPSPKTARQAQHRQACSTKNLKRTAGSKGPEGWRSIVSVAPFSMFNARRVCLLFMAVLHYLLGFHPVCFHIRGHLARVRVRSVSNLTAAHVCAR